MDAFFTHRLEDPSQLPDVEGEKLSFAFELEKHAEETWFVLRFEDREIWRELAWWGSPERFDEIEAVLRTKYGSRLFRLRASQAAEMHLVGDGPARKINRPALP